MANAGFTIGRTEFIYEDELTICNIFYSTNKMGIHVEAVDGKLKHSLPPPE